MHPARLGPSLAALALTLCATSGSGCLAAEDANALVPLPLPAWADDKSAYQEEWTLVGHADLAGYCADGQASPPRIVSMVTARHVTGVTSGYALLMGCDEAGVNFHGLLAGTMAQHPTRPNTVEISGYGAIRAKRADGAIAHQEDRNVAFVVAFAETKGACDADRASGPYFAQAATREVALQQPNNDFHTARLLGNVVGSTLDGNRQVTACE